MARASCPYAEVAGWIPSQGTCKDQPADISISGKQIDVFSLSHTPSSLSLSLKKKSIIKKEYALPWLPIGKLGEPSLGVYASPVLRRGSGFMWDP